MAPTQTMKTPLELAKEEAHNEGTIAAQDAAGTSTAFDREEFFAEVADAYDAAYGAAFDKWLRQTDAYAEEFDRLVADNIDPDSADGCALEHAAEEVEVDEQDRSMRGK